MTIIDSDQSDLLVAQHFLNLTDHQIITSQPAHIFLCQVGTKKILRIYKPFIGGQPPVNGLLHLIKPLIDLSEPDSDPPAVLAFLSDAQDNLYRQAVPW
ncbi:MAG: hypothetical protein MSA48_08905 [Bacteroides sp.]|nr:hypothetical protein [Bacteroides sp.]